MLKIRLKRLGRKKKPFYRIIAIDSRSKRDGRPIEELGFYNPLNKDKQVNIIKIRDRIKHGAQITEAVKNVIENIQDR